MILVIFIFLTLALILCFKFSCEEMYSGITLYSNYTLMKMHRELTLNLLCPYMLGMIYSASSHPILNEITHLLGWWTDTRFQSTQRWTHSLTIYFQNGTDRLGKVPGFCCKSCCDSRSNPSQTSQECFSGQCSSVTKIIKKSVFICKMIKETAPFNKVNLFF